jgi:hypothetical protein
LSLRGITKSGIDAILLTDVMRSLLTGAGNRLLPIRKKLFLYNQVRWRVTSAIELMEVINISILLSGSAYKLALSNTRTIRRYLPIASSPDQEAFI